MAFFSRQKSLIACEMRRYLPHEYDAIYDTAKASE